MERILVKLVSYIAVMVALTLFGFVHSIEAYSVYMADTSHNVVRVYDTEKKILSEPIPVGLGPRSIAFTPDGETAYVANQSGSVTAIRTMDNKVVASISIGSPAKKIAITPDGKKLYVTSHGGVVSVIDTVQGRIFTRFLTQGNGGEYYGSGLAVTPDGRKVYICEEKSIAVVYTATNVVRKRIPLSHYAAEKIVLSRNGRWAYILNVVHGLIEVLDTKKDEIVNRICYLGGPWDAAETLNQCRIYVSIPIIGNREFLKKGRGAILTVDVNQPECTFNGYLDMIFLAPRAFGLAVLPDNSTIFVAHRQDHEVSAINVKTKEITTIIGAYADALAIMPPPQHQEFLTQGPIEPSEKTLAKMSNYAYMIGKTAELFAPINEYELIKPFSGSNGFAACAFQKDDQIVIAFRGTDLTKNLGLLSGTWLEGFNWVEEPLSIALDKTNRGNIFADVSWILPGVDLTKTLQSYVEQAADFLLDINRKYSPAKITLTGHSLGGAIAQILGARTDLPTVAFNAPGVRKQSNELQNNFVLKKLDKVCFQNQGTIDNYRMYGDLVSQSGDHIGRVWTISSPFERDRNKYILTGDKVLETVMRYHSMDFMLLQLEDDAPSVPGLICPEAKSLLKAAQEQHNDSSGK